FFFFFQAEDGIRDFHVTGVQTCALPIYAWGELGSVGVGSGDFAVTGQLTTYFGDKSLLEKLYNNSETSLDFTFHDEAGQCLLFEIGRASCRERVESSVGAGASKK